MPERPPLLAGDVLEVDFGTPLGSASNLVRVRELIADMLDLP
jgi:hypothetical protein